MIPKRKGRRRRNQAALRKFRTKNNIPPFSCNSKLNEAKAICNIYWLWEYYKLPGKLGKSCSSPFREDRHPSFSVSEDGQGFNDFATGDKGDAIRFLELVLNITNKEACKLILSLAGLSNSKTPIKHSKPFSGYCSKLKRPSDDLVYHQWIFLEKGSDDDLKTLSDSRGIGVEGIQLAASLGLLRFFTAENGKRCWCITDSSRYVRQDRALDGSAIPLRNGDEVRERTIGKPSWSVGLSDVGAKPIILFVEGAPDFLAAHHLIYCESRQHDTAVVAMLGSGISIHKEALRLFTGKRVRLFPDYDKAGLKGAKVWEKQLRQIGAEVDVYDFDGLMCDDGKQVNDMNDFLRVDVDQWEADEEIRSVIPDPLDKIKGGVL